MSSNQAAAPLSDQALLSQAAAGDLEAFGVIYGRYRQVVYRFARAMTGTADAADDITHDAFLAVLSEAARFDARRASLSTYLYGIVRNLCRAHLRRASRLQSMDGHASDWLADRRRRPARRRPDGVARPPCARHAALALPRARPAL